MEERYTFSGAGYFERMKKTGLYSTDKEKIKLRVQKTNLTNIFDG